MTLDHLRQQWAALHREAAWKPAPSGVRLYHGTPVSFRPGDIISSASSRGERSLSAGSGTSSTAAFATDSIALAAVFGTVYEVRPVDPDDVYVDLIDGINEYASTSGFIVVGPVTATASLHREADLAIPVKDIHPGTPGGTEGTVVRGTGYRIVSGWQELITALNRRWYRSEGTYTVRGHEGETQFATDMNEVLRWNGGGARSSGFKPTAIIEVDLTGLPFKTLMGGELFVPKGPGSNVGTMTFDVGSGVGIIGPITLDRIKAVHVVKDGAITETLRGLDWKKRVGRESGEMDWRGDTKEMYGGESYVEWRSWRAWVCATPSGKTLHRYLNGGGMQTACAKRGLEIGWHDAWFEPLIQVFPLGDEAASQRDWHWPSSAVTHPKTGVKLDKCPACWGSFADALQDILHIIGKVKLPPLNDPGFAAALARYDAVLADKYRMIRDPEFRVKTPAPRRY